MKIDLPKTAKMKGCQKIVLCPQRMGKLLASGSRFPCVGHWGALDRLKPASSLGDASLPTAEASAAMAVWHDRQARRLWRRPCLGNGNGKTYVRIAYLKKHHQTISISVIRSSRVSEKIHGLHRLRLRIKKTTTKWYTKTWHQVFLRVYIYISYIYIYMYVNTYIYIYTYIYTEASSDDVRCYSMVHFFPPRSFSILPLSKAVSTVVAPKLLISSRIWILRPRNNMTWLDRVALLLVASGTIESTWHFKFFSND